MRARKKKATTAEIAAAIAASSFCPSRQSRFSSMRSRSPPNICTSRRNTRVPPASFTRGASLDREAERKEMQRKEYRQRKPGEAVHEGRDPKHAAAMRDPPAGHGSPLCPENQLQALLAGGCHKQPPAVEVRPNFPQGRETVGEHGPLRVFLRPEQLNGLRARTSKEGIGGWHTFATLSASMSPSRTSTFTSCPVSSAERWPTLRLDMAIW